VPVARPLLLKVVPDTPAPVHVPPSGSLSKFRFRDTPAHIAVSRATTVGLSRMVIYALSEFVQPLPLVNVYNKPYTPAARPLLLKVVTDTPVPIHVPPFGLLSKFRFTEFPEHIAVSRAVTTGSGFMVMYALSEAVQPLPFVNVYNKPYTPAARPLLLKVVPDTPVPVHVPPSGSLNKFRFTEAPAHIAVSRAVTIGLALMVIYALSAPEHPTPFEKVYSNPYFPGARPALLKVVPETPVPVHVPPSGSLSRFKLNETPEHIAVSRAVTTGLALIVMYALSELVQLLPLVKVYNKPYLPAERPLLLKVVPDTPVPVHVPPAGSLRRFRFTEFPAHIVVSRAVTVGVGFTMIRKVSDLPVHPLADGVTITVSVTVTLLVFVAV
jgi:hypothetical protein